MFVFRHAVDTLPIFLKENEIQQQMQLAGFFRNASGIVLE
jgi:hypothetical protein